MNKTQHSDTTQYNRTFPLNDEEYELIDNVTFDFDSIPEYAREDIAAAAWGAFQRFMQQPGARDLLDAEKERLIREGSTLLDPIPKKSQRSKSV